jgi:hypothetical protein
VSLLPLGGLSTGPCTAIWSKNNEHRRRTTREPQCARQPRFFRYLQVSRSTQPESFTALASAPIVALHAEPNCRCFSLAMFNNLVSPTTLSVFGILESMSKHQYNHPLAQYIPVIISTDPCQYNARIYGRLDCLSCRNSPEIWKFLMVRESDLSASQRRRKRSREGSRKLLTSLLSHLSSSLPLVCANMTHIHTKLPTNVWGKVPVPTPPSLLTYSALITGTWFNTLHVGIAHCNCESQGRPRRI